MIGHAAIFLLALALAMDCFTVSLTCGIIQKRMGRQAVAMALTFGAFQGGMTLLGWAVAASFSRYISGVDHWFAFLLLAFLGGKMVRDSFSGDDECRHLEPERLRTQVVLSVATSIDALAVGISFACLGYSNLSQLGLPLLVIGLVSLLMSVVGTALGARFGCAIARRLKPDLVGGVILLLIGVKILVSHLCA